MRLYIDKENIHSFISGKNNDIDLFDESVRLIKKGMEVYYNFPKAEALSDPALMAWFSKMRGSGVKFEHTFCPDATVKPERPIKSNFYNNYDSEDRGSIYLLNIEENICSNVKDKRAILIGRPGEEFEIFKMLLDIPERVGMMYQIKSWGDYIPKIPLSDAIICDNHYFKNKRVYEKNKNELIMALASIPKDSFNLVIITKEGEIDNAIDLEKECDNIKNTVCSVSGLSKKKCAVTLMTTYSTHSRHIITNYYYIAPTSCVHLVDNALKEDADISILPHTDTNAVEKTKSLIKTFQGIVNSKGRIYGDKKSNFLIFE